MYKRIAAIGAAVLACAMLPSFVSAHPHELGEVYVPWTDKVSEQAVALRRARRRQRRRRRRGRPAAAPAA